MTMTYRGRFAPSPTGPLHFGSLTTAMASYLEAKSHRGRWLLRIEDLDPPREKTGAADQIIFDLEQMGFEWDETIVYQSKQYPLYQEAIETLQQAHLSYACQCSRKDQTQPIYSGQCRHKKLPPKIGLALRLKVSDKSIDFIDQIKGTQSQSLTTTCGDFIIRRKDQLYAYQLAVVIDDAHQNITHVVRGEDLLESTARQIQIQQYLSLQTPHYAHTPLVLDKDGHKFSKSSPETTHFTKSLESLIDAWHFLKQTKTQIQDFDHQRDFWCWAIEHWNLNKLIMK